ncbi:hypothetical protein PR202_gb18086 [Eleusine coracana subsp. coracana]|uniref:PIR2-like helical domain-containing protein n=1 Tax=Eleusine coracana subsp. coracana TaxID=191504 RepID=A0AAV5F536_ELECO|nr:hypothetical protein PR202_gb18019 [Eleusine coracana subsp. coracana]GJN29830.1 hypothetical protein PR202_gb18086 [Eleusine coracana subsp. coracana]
MQPCRAHLLDGGGGSPTPVTRVVYGPKEVEDDFLIEVVEDAFKPVLAKIRKIHEQADIATHHHNNGFCFGLLDPISNIIINSAIAAADAPSSSRAEPSRRGDAKKQNDDDDMAMRSLNGLAAFLTYLFPYLPDEEAMGYLDAADVNLVVACLLVVRRRGMREFDHCSRTAAAAFEAALRCAAAASKHPDPERFVAGWKLLSPRLHEFIYDPRSTTTTHKHQQDIITTGVLDLIIINNSNNGSEEETSGADDSEITMKRSWSLATSRLVGNVQVISTKDLPPTRGPMKRMLLATIHGFYLQAMAKLPTAELRSKYHRGMLFGGHCYGPLDPVSNILVNTIWYEEHNNFFPSTKAGTATPTLRMISTNSLCRVTAQSLYGLVSFLCTRYPALTPDLAMQRLLVAGADLRAADPNLPLPPVVAINGRHVVPELDWSGCYQVGSGGTMTEATTTRELQHGAVDSCTPSATAEEAYAAAATAASFHHPDHPNSAQQEFLGSPASVTGGTLQVASFVLQKDGALSSQDVSFLSRLLSSRSHPSSSVSREQKKKAARRGDKRWREYSSSCRARFWGQHDRACSKVEAALDAFNADNVSRALGFTTSTSSTTSSSSSACAEHVRCIYCERQGASIVHPTVQRFHGRDREFDKLLRGEPLFVGGSDMYNNNERITHNHYCVDWVHEVRDDCIYYDDDGVDAPADGDDEQDMRPYVNFG